MLATIKQFFSSSLSIDNTETSKQRLQLAAAALLIEVCMADFNEDDAELKRISQLLESEFQLTQQQLDTLIALAKEEQQQATSLYDFTRLINDHYNPEQKYSLLQQLWIVAAADGEISKHEEHRIRRLADLLYMPHSAFIQAKLWALEQR